MIALTKNLGSQRSLYGFFMVIEFNATFSFCPIYLLFRVRVLFALTSDIYAKNNHSDYYTLSD